jgi:hypothetical protein
MARMASTVSLVLVAAAGVASAQDRVDVPPQEATEGPALHGWGITPFVGTDLGLGAGFGVEVETPIRLRFLASVGFMPSAYAWGAREFYVATHDGRERIGRLIEETVEYSLVVGGHVTYRPFKHHGFYFGGGYTLQHVEKSGLLSGQIEAGTDAMLPDSEREFERSFTVTQYVHFLSAQVGWQWGLGEGFTFRAAVGAAFTVNFDAELTPDFQPVNPAATMAFSDMAQQEIEDAGEDYIAPAVGLYLGYSFR